MCYALRFLGDAHFESLFLITQVVIRLPAPKVPPTHVSSFYPTAVFFRISSNSSYSFASTTITEWLCKVSQFFVYCQSSIFTPVQITQVQACGFVINRSPLSNQDSRGRTCNCSSRLRVLVTYVGWSALLLP